MQREVLKYLLDIKESVDSINDYLGNQPSFQEYRSNKLLRRGVERELEIIGEATSRILKLDETIKIAEARRIVNLRNWVIHGYDKVDDVIIWGIISRDIPKLEKQVIMLIDNSI